MIEKIELIMKERDLKKADVSKGADIPYTTIDGLFKKGFENARFPTIKKLALFFDVSMEYLINDNENDRDFEKIKPFEFTREEHRLIVLWRQLPNDEQMKMLGRIEAKLEEGRE
jgi:transcriptional regulator with XRE-family HTH domain